LKLIYFPSILVELKLFSSSTI